MTKGISTLQKGGTCGQEFTLGTGPGRQEVLTPSGRRMDETGAAGGGNRWVQKPWAVAGRRGGGDAHFRVAGRHRALWVALQGRGKRMWGWRGSRELRHTAGTWQGKLRVARAPNGVPFQGPRGGKKAEVDLRSSCFGARGSPYGIQRKGPFDGLN